MAKRKYGKGKDVRKNFRFTEQVAGMLADAAARLRTSENELVSTFLFDVLTDRSKFICCPRCKGYVYYKSLLQTSEGVAELDCTCGAHLWYDLDADKVIKAKNTGAD